MLRILLSVLICTIRSRCSHTTGQGITGQDLVVMGITSLEVCSHTLWLFASSSTFESVERYFFSMSTGPLPARGLPVIHSKLAKERPQDQTENQGNEEVLKNARRSSAVSWPRTNTRAHTYCSPHYRLKSVRGQHSHDSLGGA